MNAIKNKLIVLILILLFIPGCSNNHYQIESNHQLNIVSTIFPGYDFARAVTGNKAHLTMLIKPGSEVHSYEPTVHDILTISKCDIFIYVGGENDAWVNKVLHTIDTSHIKVIRMLDYTQTYKEKITSEMTSKERQSTDIDEHIWTSIPNAIKIINILKQNIIQIDPHNKQTYKKNTNNYINELTNIDFNIRNIIKTSKRKELIFGDRFPFRYFAEEYGLTYKAVYQGCSNETEVSIYTMKQLIKEINTKKIPTVLYLELSNKNIANTLANETHTKTLLFNSAHNVTKKDFKQHITYADIYKQNIKVLKEALN